MLHLLGWTNPLPPYIETAVEQGLLQITNHTDKKFGPYQLLRGAVAVNTTVLSFK